jgi:hypothetical protein
MRLFQVARDGFGWGVDAVSASDPKDREPVWYWTTDEQDAINHAAKLNRIAATHGGDETDLVDLTSELDVYDPPRRLIRFND